MDKFKYLILGLLCFFALKGFGQYEAPSGLLCNLLGNPELSVITDSCPSFGWIVNPGVKEDYQTAYQIQVATSPSLLLKDDFDLWNSGKILSAQSINVSYKGKNLLPHKAYWWRVRNWGKTGKVSQWSQIQQFNTSDFSAVRQWPGESKWIELADKNGTKFWTFENREPVSFHDVVPQKIVTLKNGNTFYDFGKDAFAYLTFDILWNPGKLNNDSLELSVGEKVIGDSIDEKPGGSIIFATYKINLKKGNNSYILNIPSFVPKYPHSQVMPAQMPEVIPFRYCIIKSKQGVKINRVTQKALYVLYNPYASSFTCSDERVNTIYNMCKYSTIANTFNGDYASSERERMMYEADSYIQQMDHYAIDRNFTNGRYSLKNLIYHASWPTEWIMHSVLMAWADYLYTGNIDVIKACYDDLKAKTLMQLETPEGLISSRTGLQTSSFLKSIHFDVDSSSEWGRMIQDIVDWPDGRQGIYPNGETDNYEYKDYNTVVNSFYYHCLSLMAQMALAINRNEDADLFEAKAKRVKRIFNQDFFDKTNKIYIDGINSMHSSLHANMFPLAFGLVPVEYKANVVNYIKSKWMACGVYGANYLMEALYNSGEGKYALELMTNDSDRGWLNMIRVGATMTTEAWDQKYMPAYYSWNHAWSASPVHIISRWLMGIHPGQPGFGKIIIKPQPGDLKWASIKLPTIRGDIEASLKQKAGYSFELDITIPANTTSKVYLPKIAESYSLTVDGKILKDVATEGAWIVIDSSSGRHSFEIKKM